jgi:lipoprotein signal peptidase
MAKRSYRGLLWGLALLGLALDQGTKYGVFRWLHGVAEHRHAARGDYVVIPNVFSLLADFDQPENADSVLAPLRTWSGNRLPMVNHGALFGLGRDYVTLANGIFAVVSVAAAVAIAYWSTRQSTARDRALCIALGLILAGTLGNLYDRLVFNGVRDFLYWHYKDVFEWPVFNLADCCLVLGAFLLLAQAFWSHSTAAAAAAAQPNTLSPEMAEAK